MNIQRLLIPGSDCVYFKIYTGKKASDELLHKVIKPIIILLKKNDYISKWFFIRYSDPDFHLRIRIFVTDRIFIGEIINIFYNNLQHWKANNYLYKVQIDTYSRELERYGNIFIEETEELFCTDSECILNILPLFNKNENYRWMIAIKLIDSLFLDFNLDLQQKQIIMEQMSHSYKQEFGFNLYNAKQFNHIYRKQRKIVESILNSQLIDLEFCKSYHYVNKRTKQSRIPIEKIKNRMHNCPSKDLNKLLNSYIHMTMNRLFPDNARVHELIIYDMTNRYYISALSRSKNPTP